MINNIMGPDETWCAFFRRRLIFTFRPINVHFEVKLTFAPKITAVGKMHSFYSVMAHSSIIN